MKLHLNRILTTGGTGNDKRKHDVNLNENIEMFKFGQIQRKVKDNNSSAEGNVHDRVVLCF